MLIGDFIKQIQACCEQALIQDYSYGRSRQYFELEIVFYDGYEEQQKQIIEFLKNKYDIFKFHHQPKVLTCKFWFRYTDAENGFVLKERKKNIWKRQKA